MSAHVAYITRSWSTPLYIQVTETREANGLKIFICEKYDILKKIYIYLLGAKTNTPRLRPQLLPVTFFTFNHTLSLSVAGWRLHNYIISARAHRRLIPAPPPPGPLVSVQNTLIPGGLACLKNEGKWAYSRRTGAAHPHGGAPLLSPAMISRHDRAHVYGTTRASVWLPASLCRFAALRDALMEREDVMRQSRDF